MTSATWCAPGSTSPITAVVDAVSRVHGEVFAGVRPASTMVVVAGLLDPRWVYEAELDAISPP